MKYLLYLRSISFLNVQSFKRIVHGVLGYELVLTIGEIQRAGVERGGLGGSRS